MVDRRPKRSEEEALARLLDTLLAGGEASDRLWGELRAFVLRHRLEVFSRGQDHGLHLLPVHYHSPVPDTRELTELDFRRRDELLRHLHVDVAAQLSFLESAARWTGETHDLPDERGPDDAFHWGNDFFGPLDALTYYGVVRELRPRRIVEIGGGYSTLLAARAAALNGETELVCVDPYPAAALRAGVPGLERVLALPAQRLPPEFFDDLARDDVLFVDSSHVSRIGSDVSYLVLDVLPRLRDGVVVHFHDVFLPDEYPRAWVDGLAFLNEQHLVAAFLLGNERFEVLALNHHLACERGDAVAALFGRPFPPDDPPRPSSLWLRKRAAG